MTLTLPYRALPARLLLGVIAAAFASGAAGCTEIRQDLSYYDKSCSTSSDCIAVPVDVCSTCGDIAAVNITEQAAVEQDRESLEVWCVDGPIIYCDSGIPEAFCDEGSCAVRMLDYQEAGNEE